MSNQDWDTSQFSIVDVALVSAAIHSSRSDHYSWQFLILLKTLTSGAQHDKTLHETVTFRDKNKIAYNYSDPGGTLEKLKQPETII